MIPILFEKNATDFTTNGIGRLSDCISCFVTEERNGMFECEFSYPMSGKNYSEIALSRQIAVKASPKDKLQVFRIYKISRPIGGKVSVYCRHISYQMSFIPVRAFSANSLAGALAGFKSNALEPCPFTLTADFNSSSSYAIPLPASIKSYLFGREGSIVDTYGNGAEWEWDNYNAILHAHRGENRGVVLRYGKNITDMKQETNIENTITGIVSYWQSDEITVALSTPEESSNARNFPFPRTVVMDFSDKFDNAPTEAALRKATRDYMTENNVGVPDVDIDVSFVNLADTIEYKDGIVQEIYLCDTVTVDFVALGVQTTAKVIKTKYDVLNERYDSIEIGSGKSTVSSTLEEQAKNISAMPTTDQMHTSIDRATGVLNSGLRGHVIINRNKEGWANEILFLDNENVAQARNVLRINNNGIGFSSTGYNGPYYQSWTIDGHFALGGVNNAYGDFEILDSSGNTLGQWNKDGLKLYDSSEKMLLAINHGGLYLYNTSGKVITRMTNSGLYLYDDDGKVLAQMTNRGLNMYSGSIEGGSIKLGNGTFSVTNSGKVTASDINITGGTIRVGDKFRVDNKGNLVANDGTFNNIKINEGTIKIGSNFSVDAAGNLTANNGTFNGGKFTISGKSNKLFYTDIDEEGTPYVVFGGYRAWEWGDGVYLADAKNQEDGISDNEKMQFFTGWSGDYPKTGKAQSYFDNFDTCISESTIYTGDIYCSHPAFHGGDGWWSLGRCIEDLYYGTHGVETLYQMIKNIPTGGGDE